MEVNSVMRMLIAMTPTAVTYVGAELATQGMDSIVLVSINFEHVKVTINIH